MVYKLLPRNYTLVEFLAKVFGFPFNMMHHTVHGFLILSLLAIQYVAGLRFAMYIDK
jgi:hypothetical protein